MLTIIMEEYFEACTAWRDIPGHEGRYQASNAGGIRSVFGQAPQVKRQRLHKGYLHVALRVPQKAGPAREVTASVHRLVALAFIPNDSPDKALVLHGNGNRTDNCVSNLRWGTHKENYADAVRHGTAVRMPRAA